MGERTRHCVQNGIYNLNCLVHILQKTNITNAHKRLGGLSALRFKLPSPNINYFVPRFLIGNHIYIYVVISNTYGI